MDADHRSMQKIEQIVDIWRGRQLTAFEATQEIRDILRKQWEDEGNELP